MRRWRQRVRTAGHTAAHAPLPAAALAVRHVVVFRLRRPSIRALLENEDSAAAPPSVQGDGLGLRTPACRADPRVAMTGIRP